MYQKKTEKIYQCPLEYTFEVFGGKWVPTLFCLLVHEETMRYGEIRRKMDGISDPVLASTLKTLMENGIINREFYNEMPVRIEYSLTDKGRTAIPILQTICHWSAMYNNKGIQPSFAWCQDCQHNSVPEKPLEQQE